MMEVASSRLPLYDGCYAIFISGNRDDFFAVDYATGAMRKYSKMGFDV
jgi:hypothetical protein